MSNIIDSIIDGKSAYAYAFMTSNCGYGHMIVNIRSEARSEFSGRSNAMIKITCQIGSGDGFDTRGPYAIRYGLSSNDDVILPADIETVSKMVKKIEKYLAKTEAEMGPTRTYAEFCQRILLGSGVGALITEPQDGWVTGGRMSDKMLVNVGAASMKRLSQMEDNLIVAFSRKAA